MNIGKSIELCLVINGISKGDLAKKLGVTPNTVTTLCKGKTCSGKALDSLCLVFNMKASDFVALGED